MREHRTDVAARPLHRGESVLGAHGQAAAAGRRRSRRALGCALAHAARLVCGRVARRATRLGPSARGDRGERRGYDRGGSARELLDPRAEVVAATARRRCARDAAPPRARALVARVRDGADQPILRLLLRRRPGSGRQRPRGRPVRELARTGAGRSDAESLHGARRVSRDAPHAPRERGRDGHHLARADLGVPVEQRERLISRRSCSTSTAGPRGARTSAGWRDRRWRRR